MHSSVKICNSHVNNPHSKLQRKILLDITICKQCTFHVNNSILNQHTLQWGNTGRVLVHRNLCPSSNPILGAKPWLLLDTWWLYMHACIKKGRRLENKKIFELKSRGYRDGIKRKETRYKRDGVWVTAHNGITQCAMPTSWWCNPYIVALLKTTTWIEFIHWSKSSTTKWTFENHTYQNQYPVCSYHTEVRNWLWRRLRDKGRKGKIFSVGRMSVQWIIAEVYLFHRLHENHPSRLI